MEDLGALSGGDPVPDDASSPALQAVAEAMVAEDPAVLDAALLALSPEDWDELAALIGPAATGSVERLRSRSAEARLGRVFLLPGIMGTDLALLGEHDVPSLLWFSIKALAGGGLRKLVLPLDGSPATFRIRTGGLLKLFYLPMQVRLGVRWRAQLFPYDWRLDIDDLADELAEAIRPFGGEPVHLVAHSMGGLVARAMIRRHPDLWRSLQVDVDGVPSGGRLLMLGTPNGGSFAPVLAFTGRDVKIRVLSLVNPHLSRNDLMEVVSTFPGLYQMLPSPASERAGVNDLYKADSWPSGFVDQSLLDRARNFHHSIGGVIEPDRMVQVAGFGHRTVEGVERNGDKLRWRMTRRGDGNVPHTLGQLDGVTTFWSTAKHGSLAKDRAVLRAVDELLEQGTTSHLPSGPEPPARRAADDDGWIDDDELEQEQELDALRKLALKRDAMVLSDVLPVLDSAGDALPQVNLRLEVVWDDIGNADADVVAVGHYQDVYPTASEAALDRALSGSASDDRVLGVATGRGVLVGLLGEVSLIPWNREGGRRSTVATVGLGRPGNFGLPQHEVLIRNLLWTAERAAGARSLASVLIGSGSGNLTITDALQSLIRAIDVAVRERELTGELATICIVEYELGRARSILGTLKRLLAGRGSDAPADIALEPQLVEGAGGTINDETALLELLALAVNDQKWAITRVGGLLASSVVRDGLVGRLGALAKAGLDDFEILQRRGDESNPTPTRLSLLVRDGELWASAISDAATVPERRLGIELSLFQDLLTQVDLEADGDLERTGALLLRVAVPAEFRPLLGRGRSTVVEVDRHTAALPWEILATEPGGLPGRYLGLNTALARQLRTTVSRPPTVTGRVSLRRVLVIGDPGAPSGGGFLPGARAEALNVVRLLERHNVAVHFLLGPDGAPTPKGSSGPATLANVLHHLLHHEYDIVHYAGHGTFSSDDPKAASGWMLADGLLKASHLTMVERLPLVLVANACDSGRMSTGLPGLADEFIGRGVRHLVGTAHAVDDTSAKAFSEQFYGVLLGSSTSEGNQDMRTLGKAVLDGRRKLAEGPGLDWDAYQLYGDPEFRFWLPAVASPPPSLLADADQGDATDRE